MDITSAIEMAERLRLTPNGRESRGDCLACDYAEAFALAVKEGRTVWRCASCQNQKATTAAVRASIGTGRHSPLKAKPPKTDGADTRTAHASPIFDSAKPIPGTPAYAHLGFRGATKRQRRVRVRRE
jgi:hypothetical protein